MLVKNVKTWTFEQNLASDSCEIAIWSKFGKKFSAKFFFNIPYFGQFLQNNLDGK